MREGSYFAFAEEILKDYTPGALISTPSSPPTLILIALSGLVESSGKMVLLLEVIQQCCLLGALRFVIDSCIRMKNVINILFIINPTTDERVLVFSQSLTTLTYIEDV